MIDFLVLFLVGIFVGFVGTVVGVGGGFIVVPFLTIVYQFSPQLAVGTSMCIVALNSISGAVSYARQRRIDYRTGFFFSAAMIPGTYLGALLLQLVSKKVFDIGFGIFLLLIAAYSLWKENAKNNNRTPAPLEFVRPKFNLAMGMIISFFVGWYASMAGVGGGLIHVPAMMYLFHFHVYYAIPTSIFILAISSTFAVLSHSVVGVIEWSFVPFLGIGAVLGAQIGGTLSKSFNSKWILRALVVMIVVAAIRLISKYL